MLVITKPMRFAFAAFFGAFAFGITLLYRGVLHGQIDVNDLQLGILAHGVAAMTFLCGLAMIHMAKLETRHFRMRENGMTFRRTETPFGLTGGGLVLAMVGLVILASPLDWTGDTGQWLALGLMGLGSAILFLTTVWLATPEEEEKAFQEPARSAA